MFIALLLAFVCCSVTLPLDAAQLPHRHYSIDDGLSHSNVFSIFQDREGFIWLGTELGVSRFEGLNFDNFEGLEELSGGIAIAITETGQDNILIFRYDGRLFRFAAGRLAEIKPRAGSIRSSIIEARTDSSGRVWMRTNRSEVDVLQEDRVHNFSLLHGINALPNDTMAAVQSLDSGAAINNLFVRRNGEILFATDRGLYALRANRVLQLFEEQIQGRGVYCIAEDKQDALWLGMQGSVCRVAASGELHWYRNPLLRETRIIKIAVDPDANIWLVGPSMGLAVLRGDSLRSMTEQLGLDQVEVNDVRVCREGLVWIATFGAGLICVQNLNNANFTVDDGLSNNYITSLAEGKDGSLWIGTHNGLCRLFNDVPRRVGLMPSQFAEVRGRFERIESLGVDSLGRVWSGLSGGTINVLGGQVALRKPSAEYVPYVLYVERDGRIFFSGFGGVKYLAGDSIVDFDSLSLPLHQRVYALCRQRSGAFWAGTDSGAIRLEEGILRSFGIEDGLPGARVLGICEDKGGDIWLATNKGVACLRNEHWHAYTPAEGLSHAYCSAILPDQRGNVWIGTLGGLDCYRGGELIHFNRTRGLVGNEVRALFADQSDNLWVGAVQGLSKLHIESSLPGATAAPEVVITELRMPGGVLRRPRRLHLPYDSTNIDIRFAALHFSHPEGLRFQYMLTPLDDEWRPAEGRNCSFSNLQPGSYELLVRAQVDNSGWSPQPASLRIDVNPPLWQMWWFRALIALLIVGGVYMLHRFRSNQLRRREVERLELHGKILELEKRALDSSINPHFLFNALNSIQFFFNRRDSLTQANTYLANFARLIRMILDDAHKKSISLEEELSRLRYYLDLEQMRLGKRLQWRIDVAAGIDARAIRIPVLVIQPFVENAVWHGITPLKEGGTLQVKISSEDSVLIIEVMDDGIGIANSRAKQARSSLKHQSRGMAITRERIALLRQLKDVHLDVAISDLDPANTSRPGTRVCIRLKT